MKFNWIDYSSEYKEIADVWIDEDAKRFTGCDDGFDEYYNYWISDADTRIGENFWAKVIFSESVPLGIISIGLWDGVFTISEFIIRPDSRGMGIGRTVLNELLSCSKSIIGLEIMDAKAVIYPNNIASQKVFEKSGFKFHSEHPDKDAWYYRYNKSGSDK